jgi:hypothetical protein
MFLWNDTFIEKIDKHRRRFFWAGKKKRRKYHIVKWTRVCRSKTKDGLGVKDLRKQNILLLCKWWWKLETQNGLWRQIVRAKYLRNKSVASVKARVSVSPSWKALLKIREVFIFVARKLILNSGDLVRFCLDPWTDNAPLKSMFPQLCDICQAQNLTFL